MANPMFAQCPACNKMCTGKAQIRVYFGLRWLNKKEKPQSYCKECRVKQTRKALNNKKKISKSC